MCPKAQERPLHIVSLLRCGESLLMVILLGKDRIATEPSGTSGLTGHALVSQASSLVTRALREGWTLRGSPGIFGVQHSKALCDWAY